MVFLWNVHFINDMLEKKILKLRIIFLIVIFKKNTNIYNQSFIKH